MFFIISFSLFFLQYIFYKIFLFYFCIFGALYILKNEEFCFSNHKFYKLGGELGLWQQHQAIEK